MNDTTLYLTSWFYHHYQDSELPCRIEDEKLSLAITFDRFEWLEGESEYKVGDEEYEGDGEPSAIRAISADGYTIDIPILAPAAKQLIALGLVKKPT